MPGLPWRKRRREPGRRWATERTRRAFTGCCSGRETLKREADNRRFLAREVFELADDGRELGMSGVHTDLELSSNAAKVPSNRALSLCGVAGFGRDVAGIWQRALGETLQQTVSSLFSGRAPKPLREIRTGGSCCGGSSAPRHGVSRLGVLAPGGLGFCGMRAR